MPPRPLSSFGVVAVSDVALAASGELRPAALAVHAAALAASYALRERPASWQRSRWLLNGALVATAAAAIGLWLRGAMALVALAHFAHLALALQLLDARPRRSDFLLVALALFQMILAASLTDSLLFPPLLLAFVFTVVWTLVVHTLWMESLAAGEAWCRTRAQAPGLLRTTLAASALSIVLAFAVFLVLPRVRSGSLAAPGVLGAPAAGFSDRIELGDLGRIREDPTVVMRVETLSGGAPTAEQAYWRGLAFDRFDGRSWSVTPARELLAVAADLGARLPGAGTRRPSDRVDLVQRVVREPVTSGVLFAAGAPLHIEGSVGRLEGDANGGLYAPESVTDRVHYTIETSTRVPTLAELRADRAAPPRGEADRWLELPELSPEIHALALAAVEGARTDADRAEAIERRLWRTGRYSDTPPPETPGDARSPVEVFLLEHRAGHCEYFASAMVVLLRSIGIPARLVNGFAGGRENEIGGFVELSRSDAHAWVEVHFEHAGWVRYDPTPPDRRLHAAALGLGVALRDLGSAVELWWYRHVVEFDRSDQLRALRSGWLAWRQWRDAQRPTAEPGSPSRPSASGWLRDLGRGSAALCAAAALAWALARRRVRRGRGRRLPPAYAEALRLLEHRTGLVRSDTVSARDFARRAARAVPPAAAAAFWSLTEAYLAERFGGRRAAAPRDALRTLRDALRHVC
jgi:transglutaminase-like putative cysteine protease